MITANQFFKVSWEVYRLMVIVPAMEGYGLLQIAQVRSEDGSPPMRAYVNHGRWIVKCECRGAEKAWEEGVFMCQSCFNAGHQHRFRQSVFPPQRMAIEKLLARRPIPNRNWFPWETVAQLQAENKEHKDELLEVH